MTLSRFSLHNPLLVAARQFVRISRQQLKVRKYSLNAKPSEVVPSEALKNLPPLKSNDVIIYKYHNPRFFKYLNLFALAQFGLWSVMCVNILAMTPPPNAVKSSEDADKTNVSKPKSEESLFSKFSSLASDETFKYSLAVGSGLFGYFVFALSWMYILRSVRFLILRKDGKTLTFVTYTPFGENRIMDVPLAHVSAAGSRHSGSSTIPIKVKNRMFYYILDTKGSIPKPTLFDQTVGIRRKLD